MLSRIVNILTEVEKRMDYYKKHSNPKGNDLDKIHKDKIGSFGGFDFWYVDGEYVRDNIDIDFVEGGNPGRYGYVPEEEIWLDDPIDDGDVVPTLVHEYVEAKLMIGNGIDYEKAHDIASKFEKKVRENVYESNFFNNFKGIMKTLDIGSLVK